MRTFQISQGGFTLIEILIVVGIIGLTLTLGVPAFVKALQKEGMRKAQSDLLEACKNARGEAILKAAPQDLIFRPLDKTFSAPGGISAALPESVDIDLLGVNEISYEQEESARVRFYPNGTSDEFIIVIHSLKDGSRCTITLDPVTALAEVLPER
ncbi:MAG: type II secretion system protein [Verrucomicrobiota bacterium]|jgi:general secretion pathway protein H